MCASSAAETRLEQPHAQEKRKSLQKRKWSPDLDQKQGDQTPKRPKQPLDQKCAPCAQSKAYCDGKDPCSACEKRGRVCYKQGESKPLRGQPRDQKCAPCAKSRAYCDGGERCSACKKGKRVCYKKGDPIPERPKQPTPKRPKQPRDQKCGPCAKFKAYCDGEEPCSVCKKRWRVCYKQGESKPPGRQPLDQKCAPCAQSKAYCDGKDPCSMCKKKGIACDKQRGSKPPLRRKCAPCVDRGYDCDRQFPCFQCTENRLACYREKKTTRPNTQDGCTACVRFNKAHFGRIVLCDKKGPCGPCLLGANMNKQGSCVQVTKDGVQRSFCVKVLEDKNELG